MPEKVAELYADFKVSFERATLDVLNTTLGELRLGTIAEIASLAGLTKMLINVGSNAMETASHLHMLGKVYGLNTQGLQNMERAGLAANVSTQKMEASILGLQNNLAALNLGRVNQGFLQAAGFFGVGVGQNTTAEEIETQLLKQVPKFVKSHGAIGRAMASTLLGDMGIEPEMLQYFMTGKKAIPGQNLTEKNIEALTKTSQSMDVAAFDIRNLASNSIAPLVALLGPISEYLSVIASVAGGAENLAHPFRTIEGLYKGYVSPMLDEFKYVTPEQQKINSAVALSLRTPRPWDNPVSNRSAVISSMAGSGGKTGGYIDNSKTNVTIEGSVDHTTLNKMMKVLKGQKEIDNMINFQDAAIQSAPGQ